MLLLPERKFTMLLLAMNICHWRVYNLIYGSLKSEFVSAEVTTYSWVGWLPTRTRLCCGPQSQPICGVEKDPFNIIKF